jgi:MYXO-CTERM domain-containing protein
MRFLSFFCALTISSPAAAHPVVVDGAVADWMVRSPASANLAIVARDATSRGELVWLDATGDQRTDLGTAPEADLTSFAVTADATNIYFRASVAGLPLGPTDIPQLQIAVDLDRDGTGQSDFAGFADTDVSPEALFEFLVQTQLTGGVPSVRVIDESFATVASGTIALVPPVVEISVPWSAFGLSGPPPVVRLTVTTYREALVTGQTVPIGDPTISNALDCVSNGNNPVASGFPNSFAQDLSDGDVDHFVDVWFEGDGDVIAPVVIARFLSDATSPGPEWVQIRNQSALSVDLTRYAVGDEETVDAGEGMFAFPSGTLAPGASVIVASSGGAFSTTYGSAADFEFSASADPAADMVRDTAWVTASGAFALGNAGDEVLLLGPNRTILDVVPYGTGAYSGVIARPAIPRDNVAFRAIDTQDTDDAVVDFRTAADCAVAADCGVCNTCASFTCAPTPGVSCADGTVCNGAEVCDAAGACVAGTALDCDDTNVCTADSCDAVTGCANAPTPGASCADATVCNGAEVCDATGACVAGTALDCDDTNVCTADGCDAVTGCENTPTPGASCADGDACNGAELCDATGACALGTSLACGDTNPCTADSCDTALGCRNVPTPGISCADATVCNGAEVCDAAGACAAGTPLDCDDTNVCTADSCDATSGCANTPTPGTSCGDGDACNGAETCSAAGACVAGTPPVCSDGNPCTADMCVPASGCSNPPTPGESCADATVCNGLEVCDATGACAAGTALDCDDMNECTADSCDAIAGCDNEPTEGTTCDDGDLCTMDDRCDATGACAGTPAEMCMDAGMPDGGVDAGAMDGGAMDAGATDAGSVDAGSTDAGSTGDGGSTADASGLDSGATDAATVGGPTGGGCGCDTTAPDESALALLAIVLVALHRRRRR